MLCIYYDTICYYVCVCVCVCVCIHKSPLWPTERVYPEN